jgi:septum site-determining protein MinD
MKKVIGIVSGKGGVGKTTVTLNLGLALKEFNEDVTIVDGDLTTSNLGLYLGIYRFGLTLHDLLKKRAKVDSAIFVHTTGLKILPASVASKKFKVSLKKLKKILRKLDGTVLVDSPPGIDTLPLNILKASDEIIIITNPEISSISDSMKVAQTANSLNKKVIGTILNRIHNSGYELTEKEVESALGIPLIGTIPEDKSIKQANFYGTPLLVYKPLSPASIAFKQIAARLLNREFKPPRFLMLRRLLRFSR